MDNPAIRLPIPTTARLDENAEDFDLAPYTPESACLWSNKISARILGSSRTNVTRVIRVCDETISIREDSTGGCACMELSAGESMG